MNLIDLQQYTTDEDRAVEYFRTQGLVRRYDWLALQKAKKTEESSIGCRQWAMTFIMGTGPGLRSLMTNKNRKGQ